MANTNIILTSSEDDAQVMKLKLDKFRAVLRANKIEHTFSEQIRWTWPEDTEVLEYVWRYEFPAGIDFNLM